MSDHDTESLKPIRGSSTALKYFILIILVMFLASFAVKNMHMVEVHYYDYKFHLHTFEAPLLWIVFTSLTVGYLLAWTFGFLTQMRLQSTIRKQSRSIRSMNKEVEKAQTLSSVY